MFEITIKGDTLEELGSNLLLMANNYSGSIDATSAPAPKPRKAKAAAPAAEPEVLEDDEPLTGADSLDAPAQPLPKGADQVVDAGTGQPLPKNDGAIQMTFDDVKKAAAKLAAKDTPALKAILDKYEAVNLSAVDKTKLGDFAADVMEALG